MPRINEEVTQNFTATGQSATFKYRRAKGLDSLIVSLARSDAGNLGAAFTGTVKLEVSAPDMACWVDVPNGSFTAETSTPFYPGGDVDIRWNCTSWTTGTITARIA